MHSGSRGVELLSERLNVVRLSILQTLESEHAEVLKFVASQTCEENAGRIQDSCDITCNDTAPEVTTPRQREAAAECPTSSKHSSETTPALAILEQKDAEDEALASKHCNDTALSTERLQQTVGAIELQASSSDSSHVDPALVEEQEGTRGAENLQDSDKYEDAVLFTTEKASNQSPEVVNESLSGEQRPIPEAPTAVSTEKRASVESMFGLPHSLECDSVMPRGSEKRKSATSLKSLKSQKSCGTSARSFVVSPIWKLHGPSSDDAEERPSTLERQCTKQALLYLRRRSVSVRSAGAAVAQAQLNHSKMRIPSCVVQPTAPARVAWDLAGMFLILFDVIFLPLQLFEPPETMVDIVMGWTTRIFWISDIPATLCTGYFRQDAMVEVRRIRILRHYAFTWMVPDLIVNGFDWASVFIAADAGQGAKTLRVLRMLRMIRLLRVARMPRLFQVFAEHFGAAEFELTCDMVKIIAVFLSTTHWIACCWYFIGSQATFGSASWVISHGYEDSKLGYRYVTALHWSVTQFIGSMEIFPQNWLERSFSCLVLTGAFVMSASFVSSITSAMTRHNITKSRHFKQFSKLRMYMSQQGISQRLAVRIMRHAQYSIKEQQRNLPEHEVELLHLVTEPLMTLRPSNLCNRMALHFELYSPTLLDHAFFNVFHKLVPGVIQRVCHQAVSVRMLSVGDVVFSAGDILNPPEMFFVSRGNLRYTSKDKRVRSVNPGHFVCEPVLWTSHWQTVGKLRAVNNCRLVVLNVESFQKITTSPQFNSEQFSILDYALAFVQELNELDFLSLSDVGDREQTEEVLSKCVVKQLEDFKTSTSIVSNGLDSDNPLSWQHAPTNSSSGYDFRNRKSSWLSNASGIADVARQAGKRASTTNSVHTVMVKIASIASNSVFRDRERRASGQW